MAIIYRPAQLDDISGVAQVYHDAVSSINLRHGFIYQQSASFKINPFYAYTLQNEPQGFWIAEDGVNIIGASISWVRQSLWFLSHLFVHPDNQNHGVGKHLLEKTFRYCMEKNSDQRAVITFAYNPVSVGLYMKLGMYPRESMYLMSGQAAAIIKREESRTLDCEQIKKCQQSIRYLCDIDRCVLGIPRQEHHRYYITSKGITCLVFRAGDVCKGYAYIWPDGHVGPVAATDQKHMKEIVSLTLKRINPEIEKIYMLVPGSNEHVMKLALARGMKISCPYVLMSSSSFGHWNSYIFHSPGLM